VALSGVAREESALFAWKYSAKLAAAGLAFIFYGGESRLWLER
jgi:hypothetical protein